MNGARILDRIVSGERGSGGSSRSRWSNRAARWSHAYGRSVLGSQSAIGRSQLVLEQQREQQYEFHKQSHLQRSREFWNASQFSHRAEWPTVYRSGFLPHVGFDGFANGCFRLFPWEIRPRSGMRTQKERQVTQRSRVKNWRDSDGMRRYRNMESHAVVRYAVSHYSIRRLVNRWTPRLFGNQKKAKPVDTGL